VGYLVRMTRTPDKPAGTETHPPGRNPERQGPGSDAADKPGGKRPKPASDEPRPEASPGAPGISGPKRGKV